MTQRVKFIIKVDLDSTLSGVFGTAGSALECLQTMLDRSIPHYHPVVEFSGYEQRVYEDLARRVTEESKEIRGEFFMNERAIIGWYYIKSTDPDKIDLCLPPHIFRRCFRWVDEYSDGQKYDKVQEI